MRLASFPALAFLVLLSACTSVDPVAQRTEKSWITQTERHNAALERGAAPGNVSGLAQKAQEEAQRIFPDLAARDEALKKDDVLHKITYPKPIAAEPPNYPPGSEYLGTEGTVYVAFVIKVDGQPRDITSSFRPRNVWPDRCCGLLRNGASNRR